MKSCSVWQHIEAPILVPSAVGASRAITKWLGHWGWLGYNDKAVWGSGTHSARLWESSDKFLQSHPTWFRFANHPSDLNAARGIEQAVALSYPVDKPPFNTHSISFRSQYYKDVPVSSFQIGHSIGRSGSEPSTGHSLSLNVLNWPRRNKLQVSSYQNWPNYQKWPQHKILPSTIKQCPNYH